jgi:hypothetical protein
VVQTKSITTAKTIKGGFTSGRNQRVKYSGEFKWKLKLEELT